MTVREMIDLLGSYPDDMQVVVNGYEEGYDDLSPRQISVERIALNTGVHNWEGRHGHADEVPIASGESVSTTDVLVIRRTSNGPPRTRHDRLQYVPILSEASRGAE